MSLKLDRRRFLAVAGGAAAAAGTGFVVASTLSKRSDDASPSVATVGPADALVARIEGARATGGEVLALALEASPGKVRIAGRSSEAWLYGGSLPGREVRLKAGDTLDVAFSNHLSEPTTIHWHGIAIRNDMDGVPGITQDPIEPGGSFRYRFVASDPGTYFFHPHFGAQLDRGLYAPLIVEDPAEPGDYDREITVVLDDWLDPEQGTPDEILEALGGGGMDMGGMDMGGGGMDMGGMDHGGMDMGGMDMGGGGENAPLGKDTGDVSYARYLMNGRDPSDPQDFRVRRGDRIRFRLINAGSDTPFRVALGDHRLTVTHTDGFPVQPVIADTLIIGMGERYDVTATISQDGVFPLVAVPEGKKGRAMALVSTRKGEIPPTDVRVTQLEGRLLRLDDLAAREDVLLHPSPPDHSYRIVAKGAMASYDWRLDAQVKQGVTLPVGLGEHVRLRFENASMMWHPIHLHGHTFQIVRSDGPGPRKDTAVLPPMGSLDVDVLADNPGLWAIHCHNIYHAEAGMMTVMNYTR